MDMKYLMVCMYGVWEMKWMVHGISDRNEQKNMVGMRLRQREAMRRIDPKIELVAVGSSGTQLDTYLEWDRVVLERVYDSCDYISLHRYMGMPAIDELSTYDRRDTGDYLELASRLERNIQDVIAACDYVKGRKHSDKTMYISLDEYNAVDIGPEADDFLKECDPWEVGPCTRRTGISMRTTLLFGLGMLAILRHTDRIRIACQSILINGDGMVMCSPDEDAWVNGSWHIFRLCSLYGRGKVLETVAGIPTGMIRRHVKM